MNNPTGGRNYGIPADNPFTGTGSRPEIYAFGLRNPWRFSFDPPTGLVPPVWEYIHSVGVCIIGGYVYHGVRRPDLTGTYICADYGSGRIWSLHRSAEGTVTAREIAYTHLPIVSFGLDDAQELYLCSFEGKIYRLK